MRIVLELTSWSSGTADPERFPYDAVVTEFQRVGKHFVKKELLAVLDQVRARVGTRTPPARQLSTFLDVALDKWDDRYDYRSYLALPLLPLPAAGPTDIRPAGPAPSTGQTDQTGPTGPATRAGQSQQATRAGQAGGRRERDRLLVDLVADALAFELAVATDATDLLPEQRPEPTVVAKRYRLGVRAGISALTRLGRVGAVTDPDPVTATRDPVAAATALHRLAVAGRDPARERVLRLSMLPVYVSHDEYLFIRVLQAYECVFAGVAEELRDTITALATGRPHRAAASLAYARELISDAGPLFSLLATMQPAAFRTFRDYTEGASAIQSRSYKLMESLCRPPTPDRLDSTAYRSVPEVRDLVRSGQPSIDQAYRAAVHDGLLRGPDQALVRQRMAAFAEAVLTWRRTHHRLATRMLGSRSGTGYTEGTPYLAAVRADPVFTTVSADPGTTRVDPIGGCSE
ncbi:tryptophan 2,3-dioxygenase family protein [Micromonospora sp. NPDC049081]|uniref:tryptophan 2,3-dioxygenase family protein n=1 Tax=Micromonospora sp. NPDC049081 TaxID=3155150 RepID=UPI0033CA2A68